MASRSAGSNPTTNNNLGQVFKKSTTTINNNGTNLASPTTTRGNSALTPRTSVTASLKGTLPTNTSTSSSVSVSTTMQSNNHNNNNKVNKTSPSSSPNHSPSSSKPASVLPTSTTTTTSSNRHSTTITTTVPSVKNNLLMSPIATDTPIHSFPLNYNPLPPSSIPLPNIHKNDHNDNDDDDDSSIDISDVDSDDNNDPAMTAAGMGRAAVARLLKQKRTNTTNSDDNRPLTPTSAIAAAFRNLQDKYDTLTLEHQKCEKRITTAQVTAAEATRNAAQMVKLLETQLQQTQQQLYETQQQLHQTRQQVTQAQSMALEREKHAADGNALLLQAKTLVEATAREAAEATNQVNILRNQLIDTIKEKEIYQNKLRNNEQLLQNQTKEIQTGSTRLVTLMNEVATARTDAVKAQAEVQEMKKKYMIMQSQTNAAEQSSSTLRKELLTLKNEYNLLKTITGCSRCRNYDLPDNDTNNSTETNTNPNTIDPYYQQLMIHRGPWFSVDAVKGALAEASAVKLIVLAPTVRITVANPNENSNSPIKVSSSSSSPNKSTDNILRTAIPIDHIRDTIESTILPRFAAVFTTPRLKNRNLSKELTSLTNKQAKTNIPNDFTNGPETDQTLELWLNKLMTRLQEDVITAIASSEHFRVKIVQQQVDMER